MKINVGEIGQTVTMYITFHSRIDAFYIYHLMPGLIFFNIIQSFLYLCFSLFCLHILHDDILFLSEMPLRPLNLVYD